MRPPAVSVASAGDAPAWARHGGPRPAGLVGGPHAARSRRRGVLRVLRAAARFRAGAPPSWAVRALPGGGLIAGPARRRLAWLPHRGGDFRPRRALWPSAQRARAREGTAASETMG